MFISMSHISTLSTHQIIHRIVSGLHIQICVPPTVLDYSPCSTTVGFLTVLNIQIYDYFERDVKYFHELKQAQCKANASLCLIKQHVTETHTNREVMFDAFLISYLRLSQQLFPWRPLQGNSAHVRDDFNRVATRRSLPLPRNEACSHNSSAIPTLTEPTRVH